MRRAFVSHSTADDSYVAEMDSFLRAAGFDEVFNDASAIKPDEQFWPAIEKGIADCDTFVVVITAAATNSEWVRREVALARRLGKRVIPIWREDCPLPRDFADRDVIDFRPRARAERRFDISRITKYSPADLIGRADETKLLAGAWQKAVRLEPGRPHVLTFVALGGEGKTSLVAKWAAMLAGDNWPGCDAAFAWSFYSQGTREQLAASSDLFLKEALTFFATGTPKEIKEIKAFAASPAGAFEKGQRLARLVGQRRSLLILDGLEPLQYAPTAPTPGELKDQGVAALLKGLAQNSHGLCVVTTRFSLPDLKAFWQTTAPEVKLLRLSRDAGVHLLKTLGVRGTAQEFATLVEDVKGHALTLTLLGSYLTEFHTGDIRKRDLVKLDDANEEALGGHTFHVLDAYVNWLEGKPKPGSSGRESAQTSSPRDQSRLTSAATEEDLCRRMLAFLRLLGLFDRPATADCLSALWKKPAIAGLTEPLVDLNEGHRNSALKRLEAAKLLTVNRDASGALISLDAHPHIREYFAKQLRTQPEVWRAAHKKLFEYVLAKSPILPASLPEAADLVTAIRHANAAGLHKKAFEVHFSRLDLDHRRHLTDMLGAPGSELEALSSFFAKPWDTVTTALSLADRAYVLRQTGMVLRATGRLQDAEDCLEASVRMFKNPRLLAKESLRGKTGRDRAVNAMRHLAQLHVLRGRLPKGREIAKETVQMLDEKVTGFERIAAFNTLADIQHNCGTLDLALANFQKAEDLQKQVGSHPRLRRLQGYRYCDLLLTLCRPAEVVERATELLTLPDELDYKVGYALGLLIRGRANLSLMENQSKQVNSEIHDDFANAIVRLRDAGQHGFLSAALIARAGYFAWKGEMNDAAADLDEALEIAMRGPMPLLLADIHLCRAHLFVGEKQYPWSSPDADLKAARGLFESCDYWRYKKELERAEELVRG